MMKLLARIVSFCALAAAAAAESGDPAAAARLREFVGAPARMVWLRQVDGDANDPFCWGDRLVLMGLDTEDGRGPRPILRDVANYHRPMLVADGTRVVFSRIQTREAFVVDWEGGLPRKIGDGYAAATWRDPATGVVWAFLADVGRKGWDRHSANALHRVRLDDLSVRELVWDRTPFTIDNLQFSADGSRFCAQFPHPRAGFADWQERNWTFLGRGCWTSISPDNSYLVWIFDGPHRNLTIHDPRSDDSWRVPINGAPGIDGYEVYHPRWSNHRRFFVLTGPYKVGRPGENLIAAGGPDVNLLAAKFAEDLRSVENWLQVTDDAFGHFYPDLWVDPSSFSPAPVSARRDAPAAAARPSAFPAGLAALWENANAANDADGRRWNAHASGRAFWGPFGELELDGGGFVLAPEEEDKRPSPRSSAFAFETVLRTRDVRDGNAAPILSNHGPDGLRWTLEQHGQRLQFRTARATINHPPAVLDLGPADPDQTIHVAISHENGILVAWRDGRIVDRLAMAPGPGPWAPHSLSAGSREASGRSAWRGRIEDFALYGRALSSGEIASRAAHVRARTSSRTEPPLFDVRLRLLTPLAPPAPATILPYRRALLAQTYAVESAPHDSGLQPGDEIAVAHWTILDGESLPRPDDAGDVLRLLLAPFDSRPLLESERTFLDVDHALLPLFVEIEPPQRKASP